MGWIFLREKPGHGIQRLFLWLGKRYRVFFFSSFFFCNGFRKKGS